MPGLRVINPFDQSVACEVPYDDERSAAGKVERARAAFATWRRVPLQERIARVRRALGYFRDRAEEVARDITIEMGKPIQQSRREIDTFFDRAETCCALAPAALAADLLPAKEGFLRRIEHEPLGVVLNVAAWNYPLLIPINVIAPALLAGNAVLLKHSARTPLIGAHFERAFHAVEPEGLVQNLVLTHAAASRLIEGGGIQHLAFTGSVEGGREIYRLAAGRLLSAGLELGGKDPAYVAPDADLAFAAEGIVDGACYNAGQSCCAVERVYVHEKIFEEFIERARRLMEGYRLGDPLAEATTLGPLADRGNLDLLEEKAAEAERAGARILHGGRRLEGTSGNFFPPTLVAGAPQEGRLMQEESFGPVLPARAVRSDEEAVALMNDSRFGLTASVWTKDPGRAERIAGEARAGTIFRNRCDYLDPALPWTGWGESGFGSTLSRYGFYGVTRRKSIHFRTAP